MIVNRNPKDVNKMLLLLIVVMSAQCAPAGVRTLFDCRDSVAGAAAADGQSLCDSPQIWSESCKDLKKKICRTSENLLFVTSGSEIIPNSWQ